MAVSKDRDPDATRAALAAWLGRRTGAPAVEVGPVEIPGLSGFSNETLIFDATWDEGGGPVAHGLVIRVEPSGHTVFPSTEFDTQVQVLQALHADGTVPVPEVLWFEEDTDVLGDRFVAMRRVDGRVPPDSPSYHAEGWFPELTPSQRGRIWESGLDTMGAIHRLDREGIGLGSIVPRTPAEQLALDHEYRRFAAGDDPYPVVEEAFALLEATVPPATDEPVLCWGDSRIGNMIFADDGSVAAVLDWEMVTAGDPVQDLAWYLLLDRHHWEAFDVPRLDGLLDRAGSIERWEKASGRSAEHLDWYELLGATRYASIMTRVLKLLDSTGVLPGGADMAYDQTGSQLLRRILDERS
ncbi:MAG TPA: phosphotransferase family protein [Acidimicrobiales bacterium]|nr:phosphotransferase family protein [Acidimicrobiales bacterium]